MFQLIIAVLAIALIATLAIASVYYGGDAFTQGTSKAAASTIVSQAQQISAADVLYQNTNAGAHASDVASLSTDDYLQSAPQLPDDIGANLEIDETTGLVFTEVANKSICDAINDQIGATPATPTSSDPADLDTAIDQQYGCATLDDSYYFGYK